MDQSKKTMRHFYCRDVLWETFEQMANDFDCSIDYLINEAMRYYARSKNYQSAQATGASDFRSSGASPAIPAQGPGTVPPFQAQSQPLGGSVMPPPPNAGASGGMRRAGPPPPPGAMPPPPVP